MVRFALGLVSGIVLCGLAYLEMERRTEAVMEDYEGL